MVAENQLQKSLISIELPILSTATLDRSIEKKFIQAADNLVGPVKNGSKSDIVQGQYISSALTEKFSKECLMVEFFGMPANVGLEGQEAGADETDWTFS